MPSLTEAALWLVNQGTKEALGPEPRYWLYGDHYIPRNEYHRIVVLVVGDYSMTVRKAIAKNFQTQAKDAGFRLLKVEPSGGQVQFGGAPAYLFTGYVASDVWPKTGNELSSVLNGAPLVFDSQSVNLVESASLDALWIAQGELEKQVGGIEDIEVKHDLNINYWPLVGGAALLISGGFLLYTLLSKITQGVEA